VSQPYAGAVTRAVAFALDVALLQAAVFLAGAGVALIVGAFGDPSIDVDLGTILAATSGDLLALGTYLASFWTLTGQTPGMRALGIGVETVNGERLKLRRAVLRLFGMLLAAAPLFAGFLLILVTDRRQGLQDLIARTVVRYRQPVER
jgi:uncharacterized RDD family membrane protein YckC